MRLSSRTRSSICSTSHNCSRARARRPCHPVQVQAQVASSIASFNNGWDLALAIFGLHLVGLGVLLFKSVDFPKVLGALVAIAGVGYLADSFGTILVPDYTLTISVFTFIGEALLIVWLFKLAIKGSHAVLIALESSDRRFLHPRRLRHDVVGQPVTSSAVFAEAWP